MDARLFTVRIEISLVPFVGLLSPDIDVILYECDFAGIHFSRYDIIEVKRWVRVAAKRVYGSKTQVIFLRTERPDNDSH
jgi:hypothetical protein